LRNRPCSDPSPTLNCCLDPDLSLVSCDVERGGFGTSESVQVLWSNVNCGLSRTRTPRSSFAARARAPFLPTFVKLDGFSLLWKMARSLRHNFIVRFCMAWMIGEVGFAVPMLSFILFACVLGVSVCLITVRAQTFSKNRGSRKYMDTRSFTTPILCRLAYRMCCLLQHRALIDCLCLRSVLQLLVLTKPLCLRIGATHNAYVHTDSPSKCIHATHPLFTEDKCSSVDTFPSV